MKSDTLALDLSMLAGAAIAVIRHYRSLWEVLALAFALLLVRLLLKLARYLWRELQSRRARITPSVKVRL